MSSQLQSFEFESAPETSPGSNSQFAFPWRRKGLISLCVAIGIVLGLLYYFQKSPVYESTAQILIMEESSQLPVESLEVSMSSDEIHKMLIQSDEVIANAVKSGDLAKLPSLAEATSPERAIVRALSVDPVAASATTGKVLIDLAYQSTSQADCQLILTAVIDAYREFLADMTSDVSQDAVKLIKKAKDDLEKKIAESRARYRATQEDSQLILTNEDGLNIHETEALRLHQRISELETENKRLAAQIRSFKDDPNSGRREILNLILAQLGASEVKMGVDGVNDDGVAPRELIPFKLDELELLDKYGEEHPKVVAIQERIQLLNRLLTPTAQEAEDYAKLYIDSLRKTIQINELELAEVRRDYKGKLKEAQRMISSEFEAQTFQDDIARQTRFFDAVVSRLEEINLFQGRRESAIKPVNRPTIARQIAPDVTRVMLISLVLGLFSGLGLAYVADEADRRFRSPEEIRDDFGVPVIGHIPDIHNPDIVENEETRRELCAIDEPDGAVSEAYRAVRTALYFSARGGGHQIIQVTSASPGDGKTTLAANLAVSIADSGKRVLLVDADLRKPRVHRVFGVMNKIGVCEVLSGEAELPDAVQESEVDNLSLLLCGTRPTNPAELLTSRRFAELLEFMRPRYDMIIVDTPPALVVTDALNVAPRTDGVLMVMKLTKNARQGGKKTLEELQEVGSKVLGVIVNGVGGRHGYGTNNYSQYRYWYGTAYGYGNGYKYRYGKGNGYGYRDSLAEVEADELTEHHRGNGHT